MRKFILPSVIIIISVFTFSLIAGNGAISTREALRVLGGGGSDIQRMIVFNIRLPRLIATAFTGAALAVSGYLLQNNLDNLIAAPGLLGINHGAGVFVLISAIIFPHQNDIKCVMAFVGALSVTLLVYIMTVATGMAKSSVILSGVAVTAVCSAITDMLISYWPEAVADKVAFSIGGFSSVPADIVWFAACVIALSLAVAVFAAPSLDIMALGDETASGLGLNVLLYRTVHIVCAALLAGAAVSMCGLIGFVGLMVPNVIRLLYSGNSRSNIVLNIIAGAAFLTACDTIARLPAYPYELPCGLILSIIGAPFLIRILFKRRKRLGIE